MQKFEIRKAEHEDPNYNSEPARHIDQNKDHEFVWKTLVSAPQWKTRKFKVAIYIANLKPTLNKQMKSFELCLFPTRNNLTMSLCIAITYKRNRFTAVSKSEDGQVEQERLFLQNLYSYFSLIFLIIFMENSILNK